MNLLNLLERETNTLDDSFDDATGALTHEAYDTAEAILFGLNLYSSDEDEFNDLYEDEDFALTYDGCMDQATFYYSAPVSNKALQLFIKLLTKEATRLVVKYIRAYELKEDTDSIPDKDTEILAVMEGLEFIVKYNDDEAFKSCNDLLIYCINAHSKIVRKRNALA